jgi:hypothetical protein
VGGAEIGAGSGLSSGIGSAGPDRLGLMVGRNTLFERARNKKVFARHCRRGKWKQQWKGEPPGAATKKQHNKVLPIIGGLCQRANEVFVLHLLRHNFIITKAMRLSILSNKMSAGYKPTPNNA